LIQLGKDFPFFKREEGKDKEGTYEGKKLLLMGLSEAKT
jgi:hypothetical protein